MLGKLVQSRKIWREKKAVKIHLKISLWSKHGVSNWANTALYNSAFTHLMNFRAKDLSFPVAAAAAKSRSKLFPDSMCPRTPRRPSGDLEWSASTVWWMRQEVLRSLALFYYSAEILGTTFLLTPLHKGSDYGPTLRIFVTVGSALRMRPGFGWMLAFSAVFSLGANSLSSVLNQICKGRGVGRGCREETQTGWDFGGGGGGTGQGVMC